MGRAELRDMAGPTTAAHAEMLASNLLKLARAKTGLSQREVGRRAHVPQSTISRIESGAMQPSLPLLQQIMFSIGLELRARLEPFDDHDRVLDQRAARDPHGQAAREAARDAFLDASRAG